MLVGKGHRSLFVPVEIQWMGPGGPATGTSALLPPCSGVGPGLDLADDFFRIPTIGLGPVELLVRRSFDTLGSIEIFE